MTKIGENVWGLDFGTTTSYLAESEPVVGSTVFSLRQPGLLRDYIPSVVRSTPQGLIVGEKAEAAPEEEIFRSVKLAITRRKKTLPIYPLGSVEDRLDNGPIDADSAIVAILEHIRKLVSADVAGSPIRLGCPAMWDGDQRNRLISLANQAGFSVLHETLIDEPVSACIAWYSRQEAYGLRPKGKTLVFDMGGGTLDLAVLKLASDSARPAIYVEASDGLGEAGDALDDALHQFLLSKESGKREREALILKYPGWIKKAARELKEQIGNRPSASILVRLPNNDSIQLTITQEDLRAAFEPQFDRAKAILFWVLRRAKISEGRYRDANDEDQSTAIDGIAMRKFTEDELLAEVEQLLLVGGMSQMPLIKTMLSEMGMPQERIIGGESIDANAAVALGLGLGHHRNYEHLSLDRPAFDFTLHWVKDGQEYKETIHCAYARLYHPGQEINGAMKITWKNRHPSRDSDDGVSIFRAESQSGEVIPLEGADLNPNTEGFYYRFGDNPNAVIILEPTGRIFIRHGNGEEHTLRVVRWPIFDDSGKRTLQISLPKRPTTAQRLSGLAFHERPSS
jgi:molecular chaperone DnaK (HSP70)